MLRSVLLLIAVFANAAGAASPPLGKGPTPVSLVNGNRCNALAPQGWRVVDERKEGDGVDFASPDVTLGASGFVVVIRSGLVAPQGNHERLREAVVVATSIRCTVALRPPPPADWTSRANPGRKKPRSDDEAASDYNVQLGMENVHDIDSSKFEFEVV